mmetsp:Transcript_16210/g.18350  ORF Transcript_16210/g.18350 Transcript_16210/m.18350 type:complete len:128 (+) Transcript_16210:167-550(+)
MSTSASRIKHIYKELVSTAKRIPELKKREAALKDIREKFRENANKQNPDSLKELLELAESRLSYLRVVTPKSLRGTKSAKSKFIMEDGKLVEGSTSSDRKAYKSGVDPDDIARHQHLMRRQFFMDRK